MFLSNINHTKEAEILHPRLRKLFEFVKMHDLSALPNGRTEIEGSDIFLNVGDNELQPLEGRPLEGHRLYLDVHFPLSGPEVIGWRSLTTLEGSPIDTEYDEESDFLLYRQPSDSYVTVNPGCFLIVFPDDLHAPLIGQGKLRKVVAKVKI